MQALKVVGERYYALLSTLIVVACGIHDVATHDLLPENEAAGRSCDAGLAEASKLADRWVGRPYRLGCRILTPCLAVVSEMAKNDNV